MGLVEFNKTLIEFNKNLVEFLIEKLKKMSLGHFGQVDSFYMSVEACDHLTFLTILEHSASNETMQKILAIIFWRR